MTALAWIYRKNGTVNLPNRPDRTRRHHKEVIRPPAWFLIPALAFYTVFVVVPNVRGFAYSFTNWDGISSAFDWAGFKNFTHVFNDPNSLRALRNTIILTVAIAVIQNVFGLLLALGCNSIVKTRQALRLIFFLPVVLTPIVTAYLFSYLLNPQGTLNSVLQSMGLGFLKQDWLGNPNIALWSIIISIIWQGVGFTMVIYLAGLQGVPTEILEAAAIDGAGPVRRVKSVVLPLINASIVINILLTITGGLKQFDLVFAMTNGGPAGATETIATSIYKNAFTLLDYPTAIAQGVLLTIFIAIVSIIQVRLTTRKES